MRNLTYKSFAEYIRTGREIELKIAGVPFFIGCAYSGTDRCIDHTVYNEQTEELFAFASREALLNNFRYHEQTLEMLWSDIEVTDII